MYLKKTLLLVLLSMAALTPALADRGWRGDIRHFDKQDRRHWQSGRWEHGHRNGLLGWWWIVGGAWYFYANPSYPYPDPYRPPVIIQNSPPLVIQQSPPVVVAPQIEQPQSNPAPGLQQSPYWYYCEPSKTYYPYVASCEIPWKPVPATPVGATQ